MFSRVDYFFRFLSLTKRLANNISLHIAYESGRKNANEELESLGLLMVFSLPHPLFTRLYAVGWVLLYWAIYFFFRDFFPDKALADAREIQDIAMGLKEGGVGAYPITAAFFALLPLSITNILVGLFDGLVLYLVASSARTYRGMFILVPILIPFIFFNLQAPTKETIILALSLLIVNVVQRTRTALMPVIAVTVFYAFYGSFLRDYYLIILVVFLAFVVFINTPASMRWLFVPTGIAILVLVPDSVFTALQQPRDEVNFWVVTGGAKDAIRTYFFNPFPPDSMLHFLGNYGYALVLLHFPFIKYITPKEVLMFVNVLFYGWLTLGGIVQLRGSLRLLPVLFAAHVAVLVLFEPDFGSYFRHFSSCLLYLMPVFLVYEIRYVHFLESRRAEDKRKVMTRATGMGSEKKAL